MNSPSDRQYRFGDFVLDVGGWELRRHGRPVRLERRPMQLLILLVERRGQLVARSEIVERLWGADVFVDVDTSVNTAIRKVRQALRDSADTPAFIETVPALGYRFIHELHSEVANATSSATVREAAATPPSSTVEAPIVRSKGEGRGRLRLAGVAAFVAAMAVLSVLAWSRAAGPANVRLAVLPFENLGGNPANEYLAAGLTEDTIALLGQVDSEHVQVVARTSMLAYRETRKSIAEIGAELKADYIVESSIQVEGERVRVTTTLVRAKDQIQAWSNTYDRQRTTVLDLERELSADIAREIHLRLGPERLDSMARRQTQRADAHDLYLRARNLESRRTPAATREAIALYRQATAIDPKYALAWSAIAFTSAARLMNSDARPSEDIPVARDAAARAVASSPVLPEAHFSDAYVKWLDRDWAGAEAGFRRAVAVDPQFAQAHLTLGHALSQQERHAEAAASMERGRALDPLNPLAFALSSQVAFQARDFRQALEFADRAIALNAEFWIGYVMRAQTLVELRRYNEASEAGAAAVRLSGQNSKPISLHGYVLAVTGRPAEARAVLDALAGAARTRYVPPFALALVQLGLKNHDAVFDSLDAAYAENDPHLMFLTADPKWDPLRSDPRFQALLVRCGFVPRTSAAR